MLSSHHFLFSPTTLSTLLLPSLPDPTKLAWGIAGTFLLVHLLPYFLDAQRIRQYPGPFIAKFSDAWLGWVSKNGHRSEVVHRMHQKYGPIVRLAPNHVSIADPDALSVVYAHGNGALKSGFYDAFVSIRRGVFNTRDRGEHTRKRKIISHIFSQKSVVEFEPQIRHYVNTLIKQWDRLFDMAVKGMSGPEGEGGWRGEGGRLWLDCLPWANYLAFDIVGDLAFGGPFGMLEAAKDTALVPKDPERVMESYGKEISEDQVVSLPAVKILNGRGEYSMSMGVLPWYWRPFVAQLPWYKQGQKDVQTLAGIAIMAVSKRLASPTDRVDLLSKLQEGRDNEGNPMGKEELTAEALTLLIAGSDTTSNSTCAILYYLARHRDAQGKLHQELDEQLGVEDETIATGQQVKNLPYLDACISEALRLHSTSALGLPRVTPEGGLTIRGQHFPEGTVLSVPSYSIHRDPSVWGEDVEDFRPERWFEQDASATQKTFNPFSVGPRACLGRNLAFMELQIIIASIMRRYDIVLEDPDQPLETREGFLRKPLACKIGVKRRELL
ncbi:cytochrome P450 monooxygenase [Coprinopsis marcescibilis]|uniref:Cytochrome P450 monooxygenase n=1 Tax=Coprinopsis marcescibilis TaxID=230819 RepID=A0A5C3L1I7_COPMA|nr:cytochrome P450 monooxygenase [Coprinopsis marcescibilis]